MEFGISTYGWFDRPLGSACLDTLSGAGFGHLELFGNRPHLDYRDRGVLKGIADWFKDHPVAPPSYHLPFFNRVGPADRRWITALASEERDRDAAIDEIKRALDLSDRMDLAWVVVHLGVPHQTFRPLHFEYAYRLIDTIRSFSGRRVLIETLDNDIATPTRIAEFLDAARFDGVGICYDIGHDDGSRAPVTFRDVAAVHIDDNDGNRDHHQAPFEGSVQWPAFVDRLVSEEFRGRLIVEAATTNMGTILDATRRLRDMIQAAEASIEEFRLEHGIRNVHDHDLH